MIGVLSKLGLTSGVISGMVFIDLIPSDSMARGKSIKKETKQEINEINSIDDIELYAKTHGCSFVFVLNGVHQKPYNLYGIREFLEKEEDAKGEEGKKTWTEKSIAAAKSTKNSCKPDAIVTIFKDSADFITTGKPSGGWDHFNS